MQLFLKDIENKEENKIGIVLGLGPNLNEVLPEIEKINKENREKTAFYCCNFFDKMTKIETDYWLVCNSQTIMKIENSCDRYNSQTASTFCFLSRIPGFSEKDAKKFLKVDYLAFNKTDNLSLMVKEYTSSDDVYGAVCSVVVHQIALAIVTGCKEVYVSGVNLDYSKGYAKSGVHKSGVNIGKINMNAKGRKKTVNQIEFLKSCAKNVGCEIYSLNESSPLSQVLEVKSIDELKEKIK